MAKLALISGVAIGAASAYLLDPDRGRSRRTRLYDQTSAVARKATRKSRSWIRYQKGAARGVAHKLSEPFREEGQFVDDDKLLQKVRSEALGHWDPASDDIEIDVDHGIVTLKGSVGTPGAHAELIDLIRRVDGVEAIQDRVEVGR